MEDPGKQSFAGAVEQLLTEIDALERFLEVDVGEGPRLAEAADRLKPILNALQALAKRPEGRLPAHAATATQLRLKTQHLVLWTKKLKQQQESKKDSTRVAQSPDPGRTDGSKASSSASPTLQSLKNLASTRRTVGVPQPPAPSISPFASSDSAIATSTRSALTSSLSAAVMHSSLRAPSSSPPLSPNVLIRNELNVFSDTFSTPSACASASGSYAPASFLANAASMNQPSSLRLRQSIKQLEEEESEPHTKGTRSPEGEDLFTPSSPASTSTFYMIDAKGSGKDVNITAGADPAGKKVSTTTKISTTESPVKAQSDDMRDSLCGWLYKSGNTFMSAWKRRYFVLDVSERTATIAGDRRNKDSVVPQSKQNLRLYYYVSKDDPVPKGFIDLTLLEDIRLNTSPRHRNTFDVVLSNRVFHMKAETKEEAEQWAKDLRKWIDWAQRNESSGSQVMQAKGEQTEREQSNASDLQATRVRSVSSPVEWLPRLADVLMGKIESQAQRDETTKGSPTADNRPNRAEDDRARKAIVDQYERKLRLMEEVVEHKERELWTLRTERDKLLGIGLAGCSVEELEELESEMIRTLVRIKSIKKKKLKEDRDSTKIDLLQLDLCRVCFFNGRRVVFQPCGHFEVCEECAYKMRNCNRCQQDVQGRVEVCES